MWSIRYTAVRVLQALKLNRIAHGLYYRHFHGFSPANKTALPALERAMHEAKLLGTAEKGDYLEFGVFKGYTFWHAQNVASQLNFREMRFFGFDSFAGLPAIQEADETDNDAFYEGQYRCSKAQVIRNLNDKGVDWERTKLIEGFFSDTLNEANARPLGIERIAVALIDCDLYSSTAEVLQFIGSHLVDGSILLFDDWSCFERDDNRGQQRAFREFLNEHQELAAEPFDAYGSHGKVFLMHKDSAARSAIHFH